MDDAALLPFVTSANVACGLHAGDPTVMDRTVSLALSHGVRVGAHPGYADREHFGRAAVVLPRDRVAYAADGSRVSVRADTLCLHGDTPGVEALARRIHDRFRSEGIRIAPLEPGRIARREGVVIPPG